MSNESDKTLRLLSYNFEEHVPFVRTKSNLRLDTSVDPFREYVKKTLREWVKIENILDCYTDISDRDSQRDALYNFYVFTKGYDPNAVTIRNSVNIALEHGMAFGLLFFAPSHNPFEILSEVSDHIEREESELCSTLMLPPQNRWNFYPRDVDRNSPASKCTLVIVERVRGIRFNSMIPKEYQAESVLPTVQDLIDMMDFLEPEEQGILSTYLPSFAASEK